MSELIQISKPSDTNTTIIERSNFYEHEFTKYKNYFVKVIDIFIFNNYGELLLQKRAPWKKSNPGKYQNSVGGHANAYENINFTAMHECIEEIGAPLYIIPPKQNFSDARKKLHTYTDKFVLTKHLSTAYRDKTFTDENKQKHIIKDHTHAYIGLYNGSVSSLDRSASGFERLTFDQLKKQLQDNPQNYTANMHLFHQEFEKKFITFIEKYCSQITR